MLGVVNLVGTIYTSEDSLVKTDVEVASGIFKEKLQKLAKEFFKRKKIVNKGQEKFVEDSTVLGYLMYLFYKFTGMDEQAETRYEENFYAYYGWLGGFMLDGKKEFDEDKLDDELDNLENCFLKEPDFLLSQEFIPIKNSGEQGSLLLSRRFLQKIYKEELSKKNLLEEGECYYIKESKDRLEKIKKILGQYRECFSCSQEKFKKKAVTWGPRTRDGSLLAREVIYSLFEMVRSGNENLEFPFENARKYGFSQFAFASKKVIDPLLVQ